MFTKIAFQLLQKRITNMNIKGTFSGTMKLCEERKRDAKTTPVFEPKWIRRTKWLDYVIHAVIQVIIVITVLVLERAQPDKFTCTSIAIYEKLILFHIRRL